MSHSSPSHFKEQNKHGTSLLPLKTYTVPFSNTCTNLYMHWHPEMELIYVVSGKGIGHVNLQSFEVQSGDLIIIPPEILHAVEGPLTTPFVCEAVVFDLNMLRSFLSDSASINYIYPLLNNELEVHHHLQSHALKSLELIPLFKKLVSLYEAKEIGFELELKAALLQILASLFKNQFIKKAPSSYEVHTQKAEKLKLALEYINLYHNKPISIDELAHLFGYSSFYFMRFFKEYTKVTVTQYISIIRLEHAAKLLLTTSLSITEISFSVGYETLSYFIRSFKLKYHLTPSAYRKQFK